MPWPGAPGERDAAGHATAAVEATPGRTPQKSLPPPAPMLQIANTNGWSGGGGILSHWGGILSHLNHFTTIIFPIPGVGKFSNSLI